MTGHDAQALINIITEQNTYWTYFQFIIQGSCDCDTLWHREFGCPLNWYRTLWRQLDPIHKAVQRGEGDVSDGGWQVLGHKSEALVLGEGGQRGLAVVDDLVALLIDLQGAAIWCCMSSGGMGIKAPGMKLWMGIFRRIAAGLSMHAPESLAELHFLA